MPKTLHGPRIFKNPNEYVKGEIFLMDIANDEHHELDEKKP